MSGLVTLGIDPGITGALAFLDGDELTIHDMPVVATRTGRKQVSPHLLRSIIEAYTPSGRLRAVVEEVHAMPRQGVSSMFSFGQSFGVILGVLAGMYVPFDLVSPAVWMKSAGVQSKTRDKDFSRTRALSVFPRHANLFSLKKYHGRADAALIAWYGQLK